jgi:hypothetical protein
MLVDLLSPRDLTTYATESVDGLISFAGFVFLVGTIMGVIIDSLHHTVIEKHIFNNFIGTKELNRYLEALYPQTDIKIERPYFFQKEKGLEIDKYITNKMYRYSEFYSNTFISFIPFSVITPFYLKSVFQIHLGYSLLLGLITLIMACFCLYGGYNSYTSYLKWVISALCGYLGCDYYIHIESISGSDDRKFVGTDLYKSEVGNNIKKNDINWIKMAKIEKYESKNSNLQVKLKATIINNKIQKPVSKKCDVNFKTTLGCFKTTNNEYKTITNENGEAEATLIFNQDCENNGIAIVTATSVKCIPGISRVPKGNKMCISYRTCFLKKMCINIIIVLVVIIAAKVIFELSLEILAIVLLVSIFVGTVICCLMKGYLVDENVDIKSFNIEKIKKSLCKNAFGITTTFLITLFCILAALYLG